MVLLSVQGERGHEHGETDTMSKAQQTIIDTMNALGPRGALIPITDIRDRCDGPAFNAIMLDLGRRGVLALHRHDYPMVLGPEERDRLIPVATEDWGDTFYVGAALR
jgi:hypothetical protein